MKKKFDSKKLDRNNVKNLFFKKTPLPDHDLIMKIKLYNFYEVYIVFNTGAPHLTIPLTNKCIKLGTFIFFCCYRVLSAFW